MHKETILIVEDEFIVAHDLQMILTHAGYKVAGTADSVKNALILLDKKEVDLVLLDIFLKGKQTGIDLAKMLMERQIRIMNELGYEPMSAGESRELLGLAAV